LGKKQSTVNVQEIAKTAAREALTDFKEAERQRNKRTRYHNTELLLKNYLNLLDHYENSKDRASDIFKLEDLEADEVIISAIKRSRMRTLTILAHVEYCLDTLKDRMTNKGQPEKYEVIDRLYLDKARRDIERGELISDIAIELNCSEPSIRRWKNEMINELSILLFGVDGLRLEL